MATSHRIMRNVFAIVLLFSLTSTVEMKRIRESIYRPLQGISFCFKRANGTHEMGCSSDPKGNVGVVHFILSESDADWLITSGTHHPYIGVLSPKMFNHKILKNLRDSEKVNGIILLAVNNSDPLLEAPAQYSDDSSCPNSPSSLYSSESNCEAQKNPWNPAGTNILNENWPFPIFFVDNEETTNFLRFDCFENFNKPDPTSGETKSWPLCAVELQSHMHLAVDTPTCLRRTDLMNPFSPTLVCDKLGDQNVFMFLVPEEENKSSIKSQFAENSVILVSTKLDAINIFDNAEFGAENPSTGVVTLLSTASILSKVLTKNQFQSGIENILFAFFNGESFDYIGSSRFMYDISKNSFPAKISTEDDLKSHRWPLVQNNSFRMALEVGQVFDIDRNGMTVHVDSEYHDKDRHFVDDLLSLAQKLNVDVKESTSPSRGLPPASLQAILKENRNIPGLMLSNFDEHYSNNYHHSIYDNYTRLDYNYEDGTEQKIVKEIAQFSSFLAAYIYKEATGVPVTSSDTKFKANESLVNEMLHCYMVTARCDLFVVASTPDTPPQNGITPTQTPYPQYVGVDRKLTYHGIMTHRLLGFLTGTPVAGDFVKNNCTTPADQTIFSYYYFRGYSTSNETCLTTDECDGICMRTTAWLAEAVSPAFLIENYDFKSPKYSAWTESVWKTISGRIFLKASPTLDGGFFSLGVIIFILSFIVVYWIEKHATIIFDKVNEESEERGLVEPAQL